MIRDSEEDLLDEIGNEDALDADELGDEESVQHKTDSVVRLAEI